LRIGPDAHGLGWTESGTLSWDGRSLSAERTLAIRQLDGPEGAWWMTFGDGRPFHPWAIGVPVSHPCAADTYTGFIEVISETQLVITWDVTGPTKDQLIISRLRRTA
jgi:Family of unknown function (DUF6314)